MRRLVVLSALPGPEFVDALRRAWDDGDAVLPLDPRLPPAAAAQVVSTARPDDPVDDGDALVVSTSGTTGAPKAAVLTHAAVAAAAEATSARLRVDPTTDRWLSQLPLAHVGGLGVVTRALHTGTPLTFDVTDDRATLTSVVPTQLERDDITRFRLVLVGGSADWRDARPPNVVRTYGATETGGGVVYDGAPLDGVEIRIDDDGEIHVRGPMVLRAYRDGTDPRRPGGWLPTGDDGEWNDGGRLVVHGRRGDVIVTGGEKVWPEPVERVVRTLTSVADVAIVGRPDPEWGHAVTAVVVASDPANPPRLADLAAIVEETLPAWCAPKAIEVVASLPRTSLGKVRRREL